MGDMIRLHRPRSVRAHTTLYDLPVPQLREAQPKTARKTTANAIKPISAGPSWR
jgi:hypothetical protein